MSDASSPPTMLGGRYAIERKLARGGMADIFLANDEVLERPVVIKMLLPQYAHDPAFVERFRREAKSAAKLNHGNVVAVYDWGSHDETYFMAMEYIEGRSLAEILQVERRLPLEQSLEIVSAAAAGLGFAHDHGMVHRDVKPGNIMITTTGEVKVADFGIARAMNGDEGLTQTGNVMGTAAYFSPEQARGEPVDRRSDLYSLGVVLFELVAGERPFSGTSPLSVAYKHVGEAPPAPSSINAALPASVDIVMSTLLAKNPDARYPDAEALRVDLGRLAGGQPPNGGPVLDQIGQGEPVTAMTTPLDHRPPDVGLAGAAPVASPAAGDPTAYLGQAGAGVAQAPPGRAPSPAAARPPRSGGNGAFIMVLAALVVLAILLIVFIGSALTSDDGGAVRVGVPNVVGEPLDAARSELEAAGLVVDPVTEPSSADEGTVTSQDPSGGTEVDRGSTVRIVVAGPAAGLPAPDDPAGPSSSTSTTADSGSSTTEPSTTTTTGSSSTTSSSSTSTSAPSTTTSAPTTTTTETTTTTTQPTTTTTASTTTESTGTVPPEPAPEPTTTDGV